jgi:hypothetical protein
MAKHRPHRRRARVWHAAGLSPRHHPRTALTVGRRVVHDLHARCADGRQAGAAPLPQSVASRWARTAEDTGAVTCWVEKAQDVATAEGICGPRGLRPAGSVELGTEVTLNGQPWVATVTGLEPVGAN